MDFYETWCYKDRILKELKAELRHGVARGDIRSHSIKGIAPYRDLETNRLMTPASSVLSSCSTNVSSCALSAAGSLALDPSNRSQLQRATSASGLLSCRGSRELVSAAGSNNRLNSGRPRSVASYASAHTAHSATASRVGL
mmetsp:Transcript_91842/g.145247  ORF Transcript_91842/g.145247 Transcript_91842/m.145247 type:complete len:141 (-) Transcript_91842:28-450(-)